MTEKISKLKHVEVKIKGGGHVVVLDTGATLDSEAVAMLQALHSRSTEGLKGHLKILQQKGASSFMSKFYIGYGHKSIGDCGSTTLFIEGVSMLAAKAVQDWPLYSGQESSTRYLDFAKQEFKNPLGSKEGEKILENWREFYLEAMPVLKEHLMRLYPKAEKIGEKIYEKAVSARAFDILRAFLPAGASTNLAWHSNLRQASDKLDSLRHHPLQEVRDTAVSAEKALTLAHPSSFPSKRYKDSEKYMGLAMQKYYYHDKSCPTFKLVKDAIDKSKIDKDVVRLFKTRPNGKTELPKYLSELGLMHFDFQLDFGSFRDLQRHRSLFQRMPLLTLDLGFENWYLDNLPGDLRKRAEKLLREQSAAVRKLKADKYLKQYYIAMGFKVANRLAGTLPALVYTCELRSTVHAHPTVRAVAFKMAKAIERKMGKYGLKLYLDERKSEFDAERGKHDIILKS